MEWQPIETAPKDKRIILFCSIIGKSVFGYYNTDRHAKTPRPYWSHDLERMYGVLHVRRDQPTHWGYPPDDPK